MQCDTCGIKSVDDLELEVWTCDDCAVLTSAAWDAIEIARSIGVPKYGSASWRDISIQEHLEHAIVHIHQELHSIINGYIEGDEDHLSHAICRLAMARALTNG